MTAVAWEKLAPPRFFTRGELACKHCGDCYVDPVALMALDELRFRLGFPLRVSSGYRCPIHNDRVGGAINSFHVRGQAFDLWLPREPKRSFVAFMAARVGFSGIGVYRHFLHVDTGPSRFWSGDIPGAEREPDPVDTV